MTRILSEEYVVQWDATVRDPNGEIETEEWWIDTGHYETLGDAQGAVAYREDLDDVMASPTTYRIVSRRLVETVEPNQ